jgi:hypothetical protein
MQSYLGPTIAVDTQNAVRGLPQNTNRVNFSRSVAFSRDIGAPKPYKARLGNPELPEGKIAEMSLIFPEMSRNQIKSRIYEEERKEYFDTPSVEVRKKDVHPHRGRLQPVPSELFNLVLKFDHSRQSAIHAFWSTGRLTPLEEIVQPLVEMAKPTPFQPWYPHIPLANTSTDDPNICSFCSGKLPSMKQGKALRNLHLLECYITSRRDGKTTFCFDCFEFLPTIELESHTQKHVTATDMYCGVLVWHGLLIRPGRCPFCISNRSVGQPLKRWTDASSLDGHLRWHFNRSRKKIKCPHPSCTHHEAMEKVALSDHFRDMHGIQMKREAKDC